MAKKNNIAFYEAAVKVQALKSLSELQKAQPVSIQAGTVKVK